MICPKCESEYVDGITVCPVCNVELVTLEEFEANLTKPSDYVTVYTTSDIIEATMLKDNLESSGIETYIIDKQDSSFPAWGDLSIIKIDVKKDEANEARELIDAILNSNNQES
jgi:uncharacterized Zn finger protein (UPF0148 family)